MPRPTSKAELIQAATSGYTKLEAALNAMSAAELAAQFAFDDRDRNVRDVLIHLYEWHQMLVAWVDANIQGSPQPFLPAPYNWKTYGQLNVELWQKHQDTALADAHHLLRGSHDSVMDLIDRYSNDELFTKGVFSWTGTTTLGSYCVSVTSSHYDWADKKIAKHTKTYTS